LQGPARIELWYDPKLVLGPKRTEPPLFQLVNLEGPIWTAATDLQCQEGQTNASGGDSCRVCTELTDCPAGQLCRDDGVCVPAWRCPSFRA
jgi:hypothetical protein